jgi:hypothetical protein
MRDDAEKNQKNFLPRIYIVERIRITYFLALSRVARFYATTEQKLIHIDDV